MGRAEFRSGVVELHKSEAEFIFQKKDGDGVSGPIAERTFERSRRGGEVIDGEICHTGRGMGLIPRFFVLLTMSGL